MPLSEQLDRLASFEPAPYPVVSLYLNLQSGQHGRDQHQGFVRKEFKARSRTYPANSPEHESLERDLEKISQFLENELDPAANGLAVFACSAGELFEVIETSAPIEQHWLYISDRPHLYPLARLESQYPRYAAVVADTNSARIVVFATGDIVTEAEVKGVKTRSSSEGGWSQARFQRHISNYHMHHAKEVVEALERIVREEGIEQILVSGDEVITPLLREHMPKHLADKIVDHFRLDMRATVEELVKATRDAMGRLNERTDKEKVDAAIGNFRAGGLGVVGPEGTLAALIKGQVDELLISASLTQLLPVAKGGGKAAEARVALEEPAVETVSAGAEGQDAAPEVVRLADELITRAKQTSAKVTFIEDASLLEEHGGVAGILRFTI
jgi:peptide subunit release factor 1 (eRF1)